MSHSSTRTLRITTDTTGLPTGVTINENHCNNVDLAPNTTCEISFNETPQAYGEGQVTINATDSEYPSVNFNTTSNITVANSKASVSIDPDEIVRPEQNQPANQATLTITNNGSFALLANNDLKISNSIIFSGEPDDISLEAGVQDSCDALGKLDAGASCTMTVEVTDGASPGDYTAILSKDNLHNLDQNVDEHFAVMGTAAQLVFRDSNGDIIQTDKITLETTQAQKTITVTNVGDNSASIPSVDMSWSDASGDPIPVEMTEDTCTEATLAKGESCQVQLSGDDQSDFLQRKEAKLNFGIASLPITIQAPFIPVADGKALEDTRTGYWWVMDANDIADGQKVGVRSAENVCQQLTIGGKSWHLVPTRSDYQDLIAELTVSQSYGTELNRLGFSNIHDDGYTSADLKSWIVGQRAYQGINLSTGEGVIYPTNTSAYALCVFK